ncbi:phosphorylated CTD-interacting factor 1-like isoform X2 [Varroa jacobsoni]|uniref:phosphorylated CTD-interacting factor 1-like isoform X2 n=1 Tax=Varroa jacobsoni TaxID=62625 RepID=UPI000BF70F03|nr:phosphorylated CTD-interacting factor 1-like isoform X2 [Varroa jacobsoni]
MSDARFQSLFNSHQLELKRAAASGAITGPDPKPLVHDDPWGMNTPTQLPSAGKEATVGHPYLTPPPSERKEPGWSQAHGHQQASGQAAPGSLGQDPAHDLPPELLNQGWRKFFSKRENRFYFFNKVTNESLWEMPPMPGSSSGYDPLTDPLGISGPSSDMPPTPPHQTGSPHHPMPHSHAHPVHPGPHPSPQKRHASLEGESSAKKSSGAQNWLNGPFDLEVGSNIMMVERPPSSLPPPLPEIEVFRAVLLHKLKQQFGEMCHSREGIECPRDCFIRWLVERKTVDRGSEPVFPSQCSPEISQLMYREIMADIPIKLVKPKFPGDARKQLARYAEAAKKMIESRNASPESRKVVKWNVEDAFSWLRRTVNATYDDHAERLNHLRKQCQPHLNQVARTSVESICSKIYSLSSDYAKKIHSKHWQALNAHGIEELTAPLRVTNPKRVHCYPVQLALCYPKSLTPCVEICYDTRESYPATMLKYKGEVTRLGTLYFQKLCTVHLLHCSLPSSVMGCLHKHFGVTFEGFSSPLNCYFKQYCSPFADTDGFFGSRGDFLKLQPLCGSIQLHPPDVEELLMDSVRHVEKLLSQSQDPLSFIIFTLSEPLSDSSEQALNLLQSSRYKREQISLSAFEYELRHGFQHMISRADILFKPNFGMDIYFLQNDAGYAHWGPTPERIEALRDSFKLGLDSLREESHIPVMVNPPQPVKKI